MYSIPQTPIIAYPEQIAEIDSAGIPFAPSACSHAYGYSGGNLVTDTATEPGTGIVRVKTYTWVGGQVTAETVWVKQ